MSVSDDKWRNIWYNICRERNHQEDNTMEIYISFVKIIAADVISSRFRCVVRYLHELIIVFGIFKAAGLKLAMTDRSAYKIFFVDASIRHLHLSLTFQVHVHPSDLYHR